MPMPMNEIVMTAVSAGSPSISHPESTGIDPVLVDLVVDHSLGRTEQFGRLALISLRAHEGVDDECPLVGVHETRQRRHRPAFDGLRFHDFPPRLVIVECFVDTNAFDKKRAMPLARQVSPVPLRRVNITSS